MTKSIQETMQSDYQIKVVDSIDHDDGTATITFEISESLKEVLIQYALKHMLEYVAAQLKDRDTIDKQ